MRILYLGPETQLCDWLRERGHQVYTLQAPLRVIGAQGFDWLVSYNYKHIVRSDVLEMFPCRAINLHISLLPHNRGYHPNLWAHVDGTPHGVTIHQMDAGVDTGHILVQERVEFNPHVDHTLETTWATLNERIMWLFRRKWDDSAAGRIVATPQDHSTATTHRKDDLRAVWGGMTARWRTPIAMLPTCLKMAQKESLSEEDAS